MWFRSLDEDTAGVHTEQDTPDIPTEAPVETEQASDEVAFTETASATLVETTTIDKEQTPPLVQQTTSVSEIAKVSTAEDAGILPVSASEDTVQAETTVTTTTVDEAVAETVKRTTTESAQVEEPAAVIPSPPAEDTSWIGS